MKVTNAIKQGVVALYKSVRRFPVTILFSTLVAVTLIVMSELEPIYNIGLKEAIERLALVLALGIPISLCAKLIHERSSDEKLYKLFVYYALGAIILLIHYFYFLADINMVSITRYVAVSLAFYLAFLFIPYFIKRENYEMYIIKIFTGFFITILYSGVLNAGLAAILFTVDKLLGVYIPSRTYEYTSMIVWFVFAVTYFLANIPLKDQQHTQQDYPKLFRILVLYIIMPLLTVYTTILYMYFIKIIVTKQWPVGLVSHLVLWYSIIVAAVLFFTTPVKGENKWVSNFQRWAPKVIIPILLMMFISIGIRINAYGVTENRYYVTILGLWVFGVMIYLSFAKKTRNIFLPITLAFLTLISVFGPLSSYSISKLSQNNRLDKILARNHMLKDGQIQTAPATISQEDKSEISRILDYFQHSHTFKDVKYLPDNFYISDMEEVFGFAYENYQYTSPDTHFYLERDYSDAAIEIGGYDYMFDARSIYNKTGASNDKIDVSYNEMKLQIRYEDQIVYDKDLSLVIKDIIEKHGTKPQGGTPAGDMEFVDENENVKVKVVFLFVAGERNTSNGDVRQINGIEFYTLVITKD